jgi:hypothetical protein
MKWGIRVEPFARPLCYFPAWTNQGDAMFFGEFRDLIPREIGDISICEYFCDTSWYPTLCDAMGNFVMTLLITNMLHICHLLNICLSGFGEDSAVCLLDGQIFTLLRILISSDSILHIFSLMTFDPATRLCCIPFLLPPSGLFEFLSPRETFCLQFRGYRLAYILEFHTNLCISLRC